MTSVRTSVVLPTELLDAADDLVRRGEAQSRDELFEAAVRKELRARERAAYRASMAAAYASLTPEELQEMINLADANLEDTLAAIEKIESEP